MNRNQRILTYRKGRFYTVASTRVASSEHVTPQDGDIVDWNSISDKRGAINHLEKLYLCECLFCNELVDVSQPICFDCQEDLND